MDPALIVNMIEESRRIRDINHNSNDKSNNNKIVIIMITVVVKLIVVKDKRMSRRRKKHVYISIKMTEKLSKYKDLGPEIKRI